MRGTVGPAVEPYLRDFGGIYRPQPAPSHRADDYEESHFDTLVDMQERHFWYRGRHRFLHGVLRRTFDAAAFGRPGRLIDLGGGCGGWLRYLRQREPGTFEELALGDSSLRGLEMAGPLIGDSKRYQVDLYDLRWRERWEAAFLLDVIEHLDDDVGALAQVRESLVPGGLLYVTTPALKRFWSFNDELALHRRRYSALDYHKLADQSGLELIATRYFMFFLSPLLVLARARQSQARSCTEAERSELIRRSHAVPNPLVNGLLAAAFMAETPFGWWLPFPWGTSILAVFRRAR